ncbi:hypothetical protein [Synechococcus sp. MIT S1220]|uniref:hypothetical protein n=1 Tax=Synechococcus sp. MIT S1220 TaxID=3082549 RepID=UPI0039AF64E5
MNTKSSSKNSLNWNDENLGTTKTHPPTHHLIDPGVTGQVINHQTINKQDFDIDDEEVLPNDKRLPIEADMSDH